MIIHFGLTGAQLAASDRLLVASAISELVRCHRMGVHLVVAERATIAYVLENWPHSTLEEATLRSLAQEYAQTAGLLAKCYTYIAIVPANQQFRRIGKVVDVPLHQICQPYILDRPALLVEDTQSDASLFDAICKNTRDLVGVPTFVWEQMHGGGSRLKNIFAEKISDRRIVCVVTESDRNAPHPAPHQTFNDLTKIKDDASWHLGFVFALPCREVENLLPLEIIETLDCSVERGKTITTLKLISEMELRTGSAPSESYWLYFDVKQGQNPDRLAGDSPLDRAWIESKLSLVGLANNTVNLDGFGGTIIHQLLQTNFSMARFRDAIRTPKWRAMFGEMFAQLLWICICAPRRVT
jgi:hypothetical protein